MSQLARDRGSRQAGGRRTSGTRRQTRRQSRYCGSSSCSCSRKATKSSRSDPRLGAIRCRRHRGNSSDVVPCQFVDRTSGSSSSAARLQRTGKCGSPKLAEARALQKRTKEADSRTDYFYVVVFVVVDVVVFVVGVVVAVAVVVAELPPPLSAPKSCLEITQWSLLPLPCCYRCNPGWSRGNSSYLYNPRPISIAPSWSHPEQFAQSKWREPVVGAKSAQQRRRRRWRRRRPSQCCFLSVRRPRSRFKFTRATIAHKCPDVVVVTTSNIGRGRLNTATTKL